MISQAYLVGNGNQLHAINKLAGQVENGTPFLGQVVSCMNLQSHMGLQARSILYSQIIKT